MEKDLYDRLRALNSDEVGGKPPTIFKKKFRWTVEGKFPAANFGPNFIKIIQLGPDIPIRPKAESGFVATRYFGIDVKEKQDWYPEELFSVLADFYSFGTELFSEPGVHLEHIKDKLGQLDLVLYDGCGTTLETWRLKGVWPHAINFGELCYSSSSEIDIEVTWGYKDVEYISANPKA